MTHEANALIPVRRFKKRMWIPFAVAAILTLVFSVPAFQPCQCWYGTVLKKAFSLELVFLGLLIARHIVAALRKEERFSWILYLLLTLAVPFIVVALVEIAVGDHP